VAPSLTIVMVLPTSHMRDFQLHSDSMSTYTTLIVEGPEMGGQRMSNPRQPSSISVTSTHNSTPLPPPTFRSITATWRGPSFSQLKSFWKGTYSAYFLILNPNSENFQCMLFAHPLPVTYDDDENSFTPTKEMYIERTRITKHR